MSVTKALAAVWRFYRDGFRSMTWGRTLWLLVLLKLFVIFFVLRLFFFRPALAGLSVEQKQDTVAVRLGGIP
ncbi:MAG TPA: DUF4492 domain-containing protein [Alloprevotella sp.]|nr:DUF4492 domain-containing protein [Alloprevotella sp.]